MLPIPLSVSLNIHPSYDFNHKINVKTTTKEDVLAQSDFISLHIPGGQGYVLDSEEFNQMKDGVGIVNCARGGTISENALIEAISSQKVKYVATDVFENHEGSHMRKAFFIGFSLYLMHQLPVASCVVQPIARRGHGRQRRCTDTATAAAL